MSKLYETSDSIKEFIENIIGNETTLERYITWRILSNDKQKELIKVSKSSAVTEYFAKMRDSVIICVNEEVFDRLAPNSVNDVDYRKLVIEDVLSTIEVIENDNTGTMKIQIAKPQICISSGCYQKYGEDLVHAAETASMAFDQIKEEEKRKKEEEKEKKMAEKAAKANGK
jgi:hypothetical protein